MSFSLPSSPYICFVVICVLVFKRGIHISRNDPVVRTLQFSSDPPSENLNSIRCHVPSVAFWTILPSILTAKVAIYPQQPLLWTPFPTSYPRYHANLSLDYVPNLSFTLQLLFDSSSKSKLKPPAGATRSMSIAKPFPFFISLISPSPEPKLADTV